MITVVELAIYLKSVDGVLSQAENEALKEAHARADDRAGGIPKGKVMSNVGDDIIAGLEEAVGYMEGKETGAKTTRIAVKQASLDVKAIRRKLELTQRAFAERYGFSVSTVRNWEQGTREPETPAKVLLLLIRDRPEMVSEALEQLRE